MKMSEERINKSEAVLHKSLCVGLLIATAVSMYLRIFYGWDQDESYHMLLAYRISQGEQLMRDLWDLHQLSVLGMALVCKIFVTATGSVNGLGIALRSSAVLCQILVSIYAYKKLKSYVKTETAFLAAVLVANMLPRATQELEYGTISIWCAVISSLILLDVYQGKEKQELRLIVAAFFYSFAVLSYPTMAITVPFYLGTFIFAFDGDKGQKFKRILIFFSTCLICALIFVGYLLSYMSLDELLLLVSEMGKSGDHTQFFTAFATRRFWLKSVTRLGAIIIPLLVVCFGVEKKWKTRVEPFSVYAVLTTAMVILLNITGLRPSGPYGFLERYIGLAILFLLIRRDKSKKIIFALFYLVGIGYYLGSLMGSNLGFNENAMFLELTLFSCIFMADDNLLTGKSFTFNRIALYVLVFGVIFSSGYFVRVDGTSPANVTQCKIRLEDGPIKGIALLPEKARDYLVRIDEITNNTVEGAHYTIISNEAIYNFYCKGETSGASYAPTAIHNEQWVDFFEEFGHQTPDAVWVDKNNYPEISDFLSTEYGRYIEKSYLNIAEYEKFWVLTRE